MRVAVIVAVLSLVTAPAASGFRHPPRWYVPAPAYVKANRSAAKCLTRLGADFIQRYDFSAELEAWWPNDEKYLYVKWMANGGHIYGAVYYAFGEFDYPTLDGCLDRAIAASVPANVHPDRR